MVVRVGQMSSAFGAFLLRYDDAVNPLTGMPMQYGYYYAPITTEGLAGVQTDVSMGKSDGRKQFVNSSPANPRSIFDKGQYGNWAGGAGYTIRQGFRVGASAYRGPYLDRNDPHFLPNESDPKDLPATAYGVDAQWARGHWNLYGEWQRFEMNYHVMPAFREDAGYLEAKRVLSSSLVRRRAGRLPSWQSPVRWRNVGRSRRLPGEYASTDQSRLYSKSRERCRRYLPNLRDPACHHI